MSRFIESLLTSAATTLADAGVDTPRNDAKLLLAEAYGVEPSDVDKAVLLGRDLPLASGRQTGSETMNAAVAQARESAHKDEFDCESACTVIGKGFSLRDVADENDADMHRSSSAQRGSDVCGNKDSEKEDPSIRFASMVRHRAAREPLQYIVGHAPFRYLDLKVGPGVFIPRPETESVVQAAIDWLGEQRISSPRLVDLCTGSGAIGLSLATEVPNAEVWAVEQSPEALEWARHNRDAIIGNNGDDGKVSDRRMAPHSVVHRDGAGSRDEGNKACSKRYYLVQGDAVDSSVLVDLDGTIDAVVTNPPYVPLEEVPEQPEVRDHDPRMALYGGSDDGLLIPENIIVRSASLLHAGGLLVMEHDISQGEPLINFAHDHGFAETRTGNDLTGRPRYLFALRSGLHL